MHIWYIPGDRFKWADKKPSPSAHVTVWSGVPRGLRDLSGWELEERVLVNGFGSYSLDEPLSHRTP